MGTTATRAPSRRAVALLAATALGAGVLSLAGPQGALAEDALDPCDRPVVAETMVSQGLPSYHALARGKSTIVKYFLSTAPGCDPLLQTLAVTGGDLLVTSSAGTTVTVPLPAESHGPVPTSALAPSDASTGNPTFLVDGAHLGPAGPGQPYDVTFRATLRYEVRAVAPDGTVTTTPGSITTAAVTEPVDVPSNPVRVLVVPIGDPSLETRNQSESRNFPTAAAGMLHSAMQTLGRMLPVQDDVTGLDGTGGVRYELLPTSSLVDVAGHDHDGSSSTPDVTWVADGKYCPKPSHWSYLSAKLGEARQKWNDANRSAPASRVLGVVWQGISGEPDAGCIEGYADVSGTAGWARVVARPDAPAQLTGSLAGMELGHTLSAHPNAATGFHSVSFEADHSAPGRAYDLLRRRHIGLDEPLMNYLLDGWHDDNTLAEPADWLQSACVLTADPSRSLAAGACDTAGEVGAAAAEALQLHVAGRTDGTAAGTVAHTYVSPGTSVEPAEPASPYQVVYSDEDGDEAGRTGIRVVFEHSEHQDEHDHTQVSSTGTFDVALSPPPGASSFRLVRAGPGQPEVVLYDRAQDDRPVAQAVERPSAPASPPVRFAEGPLQEFPHVPRLESALSDDGRLVAWETPDGVAVRRADDTTSTPLLISGAAEPSFAHTRDALVYTVGDGTSVRLAELDTSAQVPRVAGTPSDVYRAPRDPFGAADPSAAVASPSLSPDDGAVVVSRGGFLGAQLYVLTTSGTCVLLGAPGCTQLTADGGANDPSWSPVLPGHPQGLIAFTDNTPYDGGSSSVVAVIDPADAAAERTVLYPPEHPVETFGPDFGGGRLSFTELEPATGATRVVTVAAGSWDDLRVEREGASAPSLSGDDALLTYEQEEPDGAGYRSVLYVAPTLSPTDQRVVTATDAAPGELRLDVVALCPTAAYPVLTGVPPQSVSGEEATFAVEIATASLCPDAQLRYDVTDGWQIAEPLLEDVAEASSARPAVGITSPRDGSTSLQWRSVPLAVNARDAAGNPLTVAWDLQGPAGNLSGTLAAGERLDLPALGKPGTYTLTATGSDHTGSTPATATFTVVADGDADGVPGSLEESAAGSCLGGAADGDPRTALLDPDGDALAGPDDPEPCVSSMNAAVDFDADTLNAASGGTTVTLYVRSTTVDLAASTASTVAVTRVAGHVVDLPVLSWTVDKRGRAVAKLDRQRLQSLVASYGLSGYVPVRLTSTAPGAAFAGVDPTDPVFS